MFLQPRPSILSALIFITLVSFSIAACSGLPSLNPPTVVTLTSPVIPTANSASVPLPADATAALPTAVVAAPTVDPGAPLWVTNPADSSLLQIDPRTNTIVTTVKMDGAPEMAVWDANWVWVLDRKNDLVYRLDPDNPGAPKMVALPEGNAETITLGSGALWVGMYGKIDLLNQQPAAQPGDEDVEVLPPGWVVKVDPQTAEAVDQLDVQPVLRLAAHGSSVWVLSHDVIDTPVQMLDISNRQGMAVPIRNAPEWIAAEAMTVTPEGLWLFSSAHGRIFHADLGGKVHSSVPLEVRKPTGYADLLLAGDALWAAAPWGVVLKIDPRTNHVLGQADLGVPLTSLLQGGGSVWALSQQTASLFRVDPATMTITTQIPTGSALQPTIIPSPTPRVVIWQPCPDAPASRLKVGDIAYVTKDPAVPNRVRKEPNREAEILGLVNPGASVRIVGGPTCAEGWVWWQVQNADYSGWTSEGDKETYWLVPLIP